MQLFKFFVPVVDSVRVHLGSDTTTKILIENRLYHYTVKKPPPALLEFKTMSKRFPWHLVVLLGSGFALAKACKVNDSLLNSRRPNSTLTPF